MTKVTLNNLGDITQSSTAQTTINSNNDTIETAFDNTVSRDGSIPNTMLADFDMIAVQDGQTYRNRRDPVPIMRSSRF